MKTDSPHASLSYKMLLPSSLVFPPPSCEPIVRPSSLVFSSRQKMDGRLLRFAMDAGPIPAVALAPPTLGASAAPFPVTMARRTVRRSVRTKSRTDQVAEPSQRQGPAVLATRLSSDDHPPSISLLVCALGEQRKLPSLSIHYLRSQAAIGSCGFTHRLSRGDHPPSIPRCGAVQDRVA